MQSLIRSKSAGVAGGRGTAGAGPGRDLLYYICKEIGKVLQLKTGLVTSKEGTLLQLAVVSQHNCKAYP